MSDLLNAREVAARFGIGHTTFAKRKKQGWLKQFEVKRPMGYRRYSRLLVEKFVSGESTSQYGRTS